MSMFSVALSGLNAAKQALTTTSHNIANANNPDFNRQEVVVSSVEGVSSGSGTVGRGVSVQNVRRLSNEFISERLNNLSSQLAFSETRASKLDELDRIASNSDTSLDGAMQAFFKAAQDLSVRPSDDALKQTFLFASEELGARLNGLFSNADTLATETDAAINSAVGRVNSLTSQIAELNLQISDSTQFRGSLRLEPNDLIDRRDALVRELSSDIELQVVALDNGRINLNTRQGVPLVSEGKAFELGVAAAQDGSGRLQVVRNITQRVETLDNAGNPTGQFENRNISIPVSSREFGNSRLGGLSRFRDSDLAGYVTALKDIGAAIADRANGIQQAGGKPNLFAFDANVRKLSVTTGFAISDIAIRSPGQGNDLILRMADLFKETPTGGGRAIDQMVREVTTTLGNSAAGARGDASAKQTLVSQLEQDKSSFSGVNLDEEAANLLRYQQAYSASGKVISISQDLFRELLDIAGK